MGFSIDFIEVAGSVLLFFLVFGMSATVDIGCLMAQVKNRKAIATASFLQFVVLPFLGFVVVKSLNMSHAMGITLLVITSSPGGSYSNWWCSMFNADLALSVTMTAISTLLSTFMLPLNLLLYAKASYDADVIAKLDWGAIFISLMIVLSAIGLGLLASEKFNSHNFNLHANRLGNIAGVSLVVFSGVLSNSDSDSQLWERPWSFYYGVAAPCLFGLIVANIMSTGFRLPKPERVTVSIECCYQNVGIATSVALTMFEGDELAEAMGVPFYYGLVEAFILGIYCIIAWKGGWTKAPKHVSLCKAVGTSYEIITVEKVENNDTIAPGDALSVRTDMSNESAFHYVQHQDAPAMGNPIQTIACGLGGPGSIPATGSDLSGGAEGPGMIEISLRRQNREKAAKKEPSYLPMTPINSERPSSEAEAGQYEI